MAYNGYKGFFSDDDNISISAEDSKRFEEATAEYNKLIDENAKLEEKYANELSKLKLRQLEALVERTKRLDTTIFETRMQQEEALQEALTKNITDRFTKEAQFQETLSKKIVANNLAETKDRQNQLFKDLNSEYDRRRKLALQETKNDAKARKTKLKAIAKEEKAARKKILEEKFREDEDFRKKSKKLDKLERQERTKAGAKERKERLNNIRQAMKNEGVVGGVKKMFERDEYGNTHILENLTSVLGDFAKNLEKQVDEIGAKKGVIDTRLQGSKNTTRLGSYWDQMTKDVTNLAMISPLVKQSAIVQNISQMVDKGIAYNVEQRAFLATIKDKIATTFNAFDGTLLRLIRIQQQDSTAARLGMESALTSFLNNMYETTEYLSDVASSVRQSLQEAEALMTTTGATAFEYQVQKWLGSMYSTGMSQTSVSSIASAIGKLASGDISDFNGNGVGNLVIMSANQAGLSISDLLAKGLDESSTNKLMQAMVSYLADLYDASTDNLVVQQQLAKVYGVTAADLRAATNIADRSSISNIYSNYLGYGEALNQLSSMASSMYSRTSMGELTGNVWDNFKYTMAAGIANNPVTYGLLKGANILDGLAGGLEFSMPLVFGTGSTQTFNVADIMRSMSLGGSILGAIGSLGNIGTGFSGDAMLKALGVGNGTSVQRGTGNVGRVLRGATTSSSGYAGNSEGSDVYNKYVGDTSAEQQNKVVQAQDDASSKEITIRDVDKHVVEIVTLLQSVVNGNANLHVKVNDYGLTGWT